MIRAHEKEGKEEVEQHLHELREEREKLECVKAENTQFLSRNNVVEIVRNRVERMEQLEDAAEGFDSEFDIPDIEMVTGM